MTITGWTIGGATLACDLALWSLGWELPPLHFQMFPVALAAALLTAGWTNSYTEDMFTLARHIGPVTTPPRGPGGGLPTTAPLKAVPRTVDPTSAAPLRIPRHRHRPTA